MPRPPAELRRIEEEERRRERAHRGLVWARRRRVALWVAAAVGVLAVLVSLARLAAFPIG
jgi:cell division septal protein FtsQ